MIKITKEQDIKDSWDLARYHELLTQAMETLEFSKEEALVLCDALKKRHEYGGSMAGAVAEEIDHLDLGTKYGLDREGTRGLVFRLSRMPLLHRVAILDRVECFWEHMGRSQALGLTLPTVDNLLTDVGLIGPKALPANGTLPVGAREQVVREVIDLLNNTRHAFKSKQVERARNLLEGLL